MAKHVRGAHRAYMKWPCGESLLDCLAATFAKDLKKFMAQVLNMMLDI